MNSLYDLIVKVKKIAGSCSVHKKGDFFEIKDDVIYIPPGKHVCTWSLSTLLQFISACQRKMDEPLDWIPTLQYTLCPDPKGRVMWEIEKAV